MISENGLIMIVVGVILVFSFVSEVTGQGTTLYIYSNVCGFEVWWEGEYLFTTLPDKNWCWFYNMLPGKYTITLKKSGCADATVVVDVIKGVRNEVTINMVCEEFGDADKDGVPDNEDACYNPNCIIVNSNGCPADSDSDGINDCEDHCPYEEGSASNSGCPSSTLPPTPTPPSTPPSTPSPTPSPTPLSIRELVYAALVLGLIALIVVAKMIIMKGGPAGKIKEKPEGFSKK